MAREASIYNDWMGRSRGQSALHTEWDGLLKEFVNAIVSIQPQPLNINRPALERVGGWYHTFWPRFEGFGTLEVMRMVADFLLAMVTSPADIRKATNHMIMARLGLEACERKYTSRADVEWLALFRTDLEALEADMPSWRMHGVDRYQWFTWHELETIL